MRYLLQLGIYDDGDILPTQLIMLIVDDPPNVADLVMLRELAEEEYGRPAPDHALFWSAVPEPECTHERLQPGGACDDCGEQVA